ncbi:MAG: cupin domain-containing protein [Asgard group archaeon]|nr:cupin domain-containing protein [Asgard group archaeon]
MIIKKVTEEPLFENPHGVESKNLYSYPNAVIIHLTLKPGESLRRHETPTDVAFYVLEGKGTVLIGDEKREVEKDTLIESPADIVHCWYNESNEDLRVLVIKAPKSTKPTNFLEGRKQ